MFSTRKKVGTAIAGVAVVAAAIAMTAGTFSYFSDSVNATAGDITAGTIKLGASASGGAITADNIAPGWRAKRTLTFSNSGSLPGDLRVSLQDTGSDAAMLDNLQVCVDSYPCVTLRQAENYTNGGFDFGELHANASKTFDITVKMPTTVGNDAQGSHAAAKIIAHLYQVDGSGKALINN